MLMSLLGQVYHGVVKDEAPAKVVIGRKRYPQGVDGGRGTGKDTGTGVYIILQ